MSRIVVSPSTGTRALGRVSVYGRSRRPAPAASTMPIIWSGPFPRASRPPDGIVPPVSQPPAVSISRAGVRRAVRAVRWRATKARARLALRLAPDSFAPQLAAARIPVDAEVAVYFADGPDRVYQLDQWIPVLEQLARSHRVVLILRDLRTMK